MPRLNAYEWPVIVAPDARLRDILPPELKQAAALPCKDIHTWHSIRLNDYEHMVGEDDELEFWATHFMLCHLDLPWGAFVRRLADKLYAHFPEMRVSAWASEMASSRSLWNALAHTPIEFFQLYGY